VLSTKCMLSQLDSESLENHTNLNWHTGHSGRKRRKVKDNGFTIVQPTQKIASEISATDFYQGANYFIEKLAAEFCEPKPDGWFEFKEPLEVIEEERQDEASVPNLPLEPQ